MLMVNEFGNVYMNVSNNREKENLLKLGYKVVEEPKAEAQEPPKKKPNTSKGVKKDAE